MMEINQCPDSQHHHLLWNIQFYTWVSLLSIFMNCVIFYIYVVFCLHASTCHKCVLCSIGMNSPSQYLDLILKLWNQCHSWTPVDWPAHPMMFQCPISQTTFNKPLLISFYVIWGTFHVHVIFKSSINCKLVSPFCQAVEEHSNQPVIRISAQQPPATALRDITDTF